MPSDETARGSPIPQEAREFLDARLGRSRWSVSLMRGDASSRLYARVSTDSGRTLILTYYPDELRGQLPVYLQTHALLDGRDTVPGIEAQCECAVLQADVGDTTLTSILHDDPERARPLYRDALDRLIEIQSCGEGAQLPNPPFDAAKFASELDMMLDYYLRRLAGADASAIERARVLFEELASSLSRHPYRLCHRDYHGENIHVVDDHLYILDFQDMRLGPDTYDLASLLRDRGVVELLGRQTEEELLAYYARRIEADDAVTDRYWESLLQRTIKTIGTFAKQSVERKRHHYLSYIPPAIRSVHDCLDRLPQYTEMRQFIVHGS
jgi:N-acetylmuramate 1-kinase